MAGTKIGKYVLESLTRSMYDDSRCIYREYVQNAADQIDIAQKEHLDKDNYYDIQINIDSNNRRIEIVDTATGVTFDKINVLRDVACSQKRRGFQKGFRGIGRLGGLGYCSSLVFETSAKGEPIKTVMRWNADEMNRIVDDESNTSEAGDVIDECVQISKEQEMIEAHYFRVILENVSDDKLLDPEGISNYLSMVAPVDYPTGFAKFGHTIKQYMKENGLSLDTYNIFVNGDQIYKGYTTRIKNNRDGDYDITDIKFFQRKDKDGNFIYWGWYSISELKGQIPAYNVPYGIRLRCKNIQIGDENTCRNFFVADGDKRFSQYFYGELNVVSPALQPDGRRDYLREGGQRRAFESQVTEDFLVLKELCNEASDIRGTQKKITNAVQKKANIEKKRNAGFLNQAEQKKCEDEFKTYEQERAKAHKKLEQLKQKSEKRQSPLSFMYKQIEENATKVEGGSSNDPIENKAVPKLTSDEQQIAQEQSPKLRTDASLYKKFSKKEKDVINKVYDAIYMAIADENMRESLINKIEEEITR